jgi:DNA polymerase-3 subunit alpha
MTEKRYIIEITATPERFDNMKIGQFFDANLQGEEIIIEQNGEIFATVEAPDIMKDHEPFKKLKLVIIKLKDGVATLEVRRHFIDVVTLHSKKDDFWDAELKGENIVLTKDDELIIVEAGEAVTAFKYRQKLKAVVHEVENGKTIFQIIRWADLHRHSGFSLLDGASHVRDLVRKTEYAGAISDHGVMFGALEYYKQMIELRKRPIIGFEAYVETIDGKKEGNHTLLLAKNLKGFQNLVKLTSKAYENFYRKPHVSYAMLRQHWEGIIATSACIGNEIPQKLLAGNYEGAKRVAKEMIKIFGREDFYIEIQRHGFHEESRVNPLLIQLAKELNLKLIATADSHYTDKEDAHNHEILLCIQTGKTMEDHDRMKFSGTGYHIHDPKEMEEMFRDIPEAIANTLEIAEKCNLDLGLGKIHMPPFECPEGFTESTYFEHLCWEGFKERFGFTPKDNDEYHNRLKYEIEVIQKMGFEGYFLIVWDFIRFAKENGIEVGPGRGSVVGGLCAFVLQITDLDPIPYGLLFERFLNPERVSMPDIDLDFQDDRRDEVVDYVRQKYGADSVCKIVTFGTMAAKAAVRDVARVLNKPYSLADKIAKSIPVKPKMTLKKAFLESPEFDLMYKSDPEVRQIVDIALKFEGLPRHASQHACGIIIAPSQVDNYIPTLLMENKELGIRELTSQMSMTEAEDFGILKMDFLGLRTMTVINRTLKQVNKNREAMGLPRINYLDIPKNDKRVYQDIAKGESYGVFQLESPGMRSFMKELFADAADTEDGTEELFERLIAGISLYRPGPMDSIPDYIKNMRNPENIKYAHPILKAILSPSYGKVVYQEQVMQIVRDMGGYSLGRSDLVRRAMGKKKKEVMAKEKKIFIEGKKHKNGKVDVLGCIQMGIPRDVAEDIWEIMAKFAEYAFNKSHAAGYAVLSNATAWLKFYYPVEFMASTLNSYISNSKKLKPYLSVVQKMKIEILPPDVNRSNQMFSVDDGKIRFGLMGIRNLGKASKHIIDERDLNGEFKDFQNFAERMAKHSKVDKKILESMIYSGSVDNFEGTRNAKLTVLEKVLSSASSEKKMFNSGQLDLFDMFEELQVFKKIPIPDLVEFDKKYKLEKEKEYAGFYVTEHPLDDYMDYFVREGVHEIGFLKPDDEDEVVDSEDMHVIHNYDGETVKIAGIITDLKMFYTKKDSKPLYVFSLEDKTGDMKSVIFSDRIEINQDKIVEGKVVMVQGQIKVDEYDTQIIIQNMFDIETIVNSEKPKSIWVRSNNEKKIKELFSYVSDHKGDLPVYVLFNQKKYQSKENLELNFTTFSKLQDMFGMNAKVVYH